MEFSLGTLNIWAFYADWDDRREALSQAWEDVDKPDILCLQEVIETDTRNQAEEIAFDLDYPNYLFIPEQLNGDHTEGIAILSIYPLSREETFELYHTKVRRVATKVFVTSLGVEIINTHLSFSENDESKKQLIQVLEIPERDVYQFVTGDFNQMPPDTEPIFAKFPRWRRDVELNTWPVHAEQFKAAREKATGKPLTFSTTPRQIDYILSSGEPELIDSRKYDLMGTNSLCASDHALIVNRYEI